jgi:hypothetical protein
MAYHSLKIKKKTTQIEWFTYNLHKYFLFIDFIKSIFNHFFLFGNQPWVINTNPKTIRTILILFLILRILMASLDFSCFAIVFFIQSTNR